MYKIKRNSENMESVVCWKSYIFEEQTNNEYEDFKRHSMFCHCCMLVAISCILQYIHMRVRNIPSSASVFTVFSFQQKTMRGKRGIRVHNSIYIVIYIRIMDFLSIISRGCLCTENWKHWNRCEGGSEGPKKHENAFVFANCSNRLYVLKKRLFECFYSKIPPEKLDNAFLRLYLCSVESSPQIIQINHLFPSGWFYKKSVLICGICGEIKPITN